MTLNSSNNLELADQKVSSISRALEEARSAAGEMVLRQRPSGRKGNNDGPVAA